MSKVTIRAVNAAIAAKGGKEKLTRGTSYYYFYDGDAASWPSSSVCVYRLNHMTLTEWVEAWEQLRAA